MQRILFLSKENILENFFIGKKINYIKKTKSRHLLAISEYQTYMHQLWVSERQKETTKNALLTECISLFNGLLPVVLNSEHAGWMRVLSQSHLLLWVNTVGNSLNLSHHTFLPGQQSDSSRIPTLLLILSNQEISVAQKISLGKVWGPQYGDWLHKHMAQRPWQNVQKRLYERISFTFLETRKPIH